jgi:nicotinate phosphoribosyltransferase
MRHPKRSRYAGRNVLKFSAGKETWTGEKQVYRLRGPAGRFAGDRLALRDEDPPAGAEPLLGTVMISGAVTTPLPALTAIRDHCAAQLGALPEAVRRLKDPATYPVAYSDRLLTLQRALKAEIEALEVQRPD